jgi:hypothetical protein
MSKTFRDWEPDQVWLLPPSLQDLIPSGHVAHFVRDTVRSGLDLGAILESYGEERGYPPEEGRRAMADNLSTLIEKMP